MQFLELKLRHNFRGASRNVVFVLQCYLRFDFTLQRRIFASFCQGQEVHCMFLYTSFSLEISLTVNKTCQHHSLHLNSVACCLWLSYRLLPQYPFLGIFTPSDLLCVSPSEKSPCRFLFPIHETGYCKQLLLELLYD